MNPTTVFILGRTPDLAFAELKHVLPHKQLERLDYHTVLLTESLEDPIGLINNLGGTVVIAEIIAKDIEISPETLVPYIAKHSNSAKTFGVSSLGLEPLSERENAEIKKELGLQGISARYIVNNKQEPLSAVVVKGQHVQEFLLIKTKEGNILAKTLAVQNIPEWVKRDYDRPFADPKRGMLPPKVARMLINIVGSFKPEGEESTLLDPFCGMGTILGEALLSGWKVNGSDIAQEVVDNAFANLTWITKEYTVSSPSFRMSQGDAVHVSQKIEPHSIQAIVTEPFLGSPEIALKKHIKTEDVKNMVKGLEKMYIGCLKDWSKILLPGGVIMIAFPTIHANEREFFVKKVIDSCEMLGYHISEGPWAYSRPDAVVERNFYLLQKR